METVSVSNFDLKDISGKTLDRSRPSKTATFWLRRDIIRGVFKPGERLKVEHLSEFYKVGQSPIREAILGNLSNHLIVHEFQRGYRVAPVCLAEYNDLYETYYRLYAIVMEMAVEIGDQQWEESVVLALHRMRHIPAVRPGGDQQLVEQWERAYLNFVLKLVSGCGSVTLSQVIYEIGSRLERYSMLFGDFSDQPGKEEQEIHEHVVSALIERDAGRLRETTGEYVRFTEARRESIRERLRSESQDSYS